MENVGTTLLQVPTEARLPLLNLTDQAITRIKDFAAKMPNPAEKHFRVYVEGGGCSGLQYGFAFDKKKDDDIVVRYQDLEVLIDPQTEPLIRGSTLDYIDDFKATGFTVKNPQAKASCGCGTSFTV